MFNRKDMFVGTVVSAFVGFALGILCEALNTQDEKREKELAELKLKYETGEVDKEEA